MIRELIFFYKFAAKQIANALYRLAFPDKTNLHPAEMSNEQLDALLDEEPEDLGNYLEDYFKTL